MAFAPTRSEVVKRQFRAAAIFTRREAEAKKLEKNKRSKRAKKP